MTLPKTKQHEQAHELKTRYLSQVAAVQNDNRLTPEGKRSKLAKLHANTVQQLSKLKRERDAALTTRRADLERQLFGLPATAPTSDTVSYRDALDRVTRAAEAKDDKAMHQLYDNAKLTGDSILTKAILGHAYRSGSADLVNRYLNEPGNEALDQKGVELWQLMRGDDGAGDQMTNATNDWVFEADKPAEIRAYSESIIQQMAATAE
ncbi:hypothetical protein [Curtobacterium sp. NPDC086286]|uniref:hypothetical protein n=1 Tax=Curtobacterium sp. NPDC086286 TaxID=3363964 RepID=UPI003824E216